MTIAPASLVDVLGIALLHFLWQGSVIGLAAALLLSSLRHASAPTRYAVASSALAACGLAFLVTLALLAWPGSIAGEVPSAAATRFLTTTLALAPQGSADTTRSLPGVVAWLWAVGVGCLGTRFLLQWRRARRLAVQHTSRPDDCWCRVFDAMKRDFGVGRAVRLLQSTATDTPMVVGCLAPVVLIPVSAVTGLTPEQIRAVLAHELAHIRRHDHWANLAQVIIETLLFFHPAVWWLSRRVRLEREHCCDDDAINAIDRPKAFAEALARLESMRHTHTKAALAANGGSLMHRITRILNTDRPAQTRLPGWRALTALAAGTVITAAGMAHSATRVATDDDRVLEAIRQLAAAGAPQEQVRNLYDMLVAPNSEAERKLRAEFDKANAEMRAAIESGVLSEADAQRKLDHIAQRINEHRDTIFAMEVLGLSKGEAHLASVRRTLERQVAEGLLTRDQADQKLADIAAKIDAREEYVVYVETTARAIDKMVADGDITAEEGRERLAAAKRGIEARMRYLDAHAEYKAAVESGKMNPEQAAERISTLKQRIADEHAKLRDEWETTKARIRDAVDTGHMTKDEAERAYKKAHEHLVLSIGATVDANRIDLHLKAAVERGDLTREQADAVYAEVKARIQDGSRTPRDMWSKATDLLLQRGVKEEQLGTVRREIESIIVRMKAEGPAFTHDETKERLASIGLNTEQIGLVIALSKGMASPDPERSRVERVESRRRK